MRQLKYTGQYKKDLKRYINQPKKLKALNEVLDMLKRRARERAIYGKESFAKQLRGSFLNTRGGARGACLLLCRYFGVALLEFNLL